jgi:hypothetical protein
MQNLFVGKNAMPSQVKDALANVVLKHIAAVSCRALPAILQTHPIPYIHRNLIAMVKLV